MAPFLGTGGVGTVSTGAIETVAGKDLDVVFRVHASAKP